MRRATPRRPTWKTSRAADNAGVIRRWARLINDVKRFEQARIAIWKERAPPQDPKENEAERRAHPNQRHEIPNADEHAGLMKRRQNDDEHVDHLHEHDPAGDEAKARGFFLQPLH